MDVFEAIRTILAVRSYSDKPLPDASLRKIVEAAHVSASSMNRQPWHFVIVQDRQRLLEMSKQAPSGPYVAGAQAAIVVAVEKESPFGVSDGSRAVQSMMLTAWDDGIGSNWVGFGGLEGVRTMLGIPDAYEVLAVVPFGYPAAAVGKGKKQRKPLGEVVSREHYGQPFA